MKRSLLLTALFLLLGWTCVNARHYTVIVSLDGCRWDYPQWYDTPFLDSLAQVGVESQLIPSFPSKTFPNHYTLATGLYPDHHGIVANSFLDPATGRHFSLSDTKAKTDPSFYGGEPIWVTAQRQGLHTAVFYWPGSDVKICGTEPDLFYKYDDKPHLTFEQRADGIVSQLSKPEGKRPDLIMAYMEQPDAFGHTYGPQSKMTRKAVQQMDSLLHSIYQRIQQLPCAKETNFIVVSDHGMAYIDSNHFVPIKSRLKDSWVKALEGSLPCNIFATEGCADSIYQALKHLDHAKVWKRKEVPAYLHYGSNPREGDVVVLPDLGYVVVEGTFEPGGNHGFDPTLQDMHAVFRAVGPDLKHVHIPYINNVDVYPLLCKLLGIKPAPCDGSLKGVEPMLVNP
jgi:predicted AlkP superfamily pyrophosphatase or phosphodiesterase